MELREDWHIFIPTRGRLNTQHTWDRLCPELREKASLVAPENEIAHHRLKGRSVIDRGDVAGIANVRHWIMMNTKYRYVIMMDDDLALFHRIRETAYNLQPATPEQQVQLMKRLGWAMQMDDFAMAGISPRQMNNQHFPHQYKTATKMNAVIAFDAKKYQEMPFNFNDVELMEDYHVILSYLERGFPNYVITNGAWDQVGVSGAPGGASLYRNAEMQHRASHALHALHPEVVKVVTKKPKGEWGDGQKERTDVRVQWRKAFEMGCRS